MNNEFILNTIPRYTSKELYELGELNPDMEVECHTVEQLKYIKVYNFLKNPDDLVKFLVHYPSEDRTKTIGEGSEDKMNTTSSAPGFQQPIPETHFLNNISVGFYNLLRHYHFIKYDFRTIKWSYYSNCCYPNMPAYKQNYYPHTDPFTYACNLFLTPTDNSSTDFFKYKINDERYVYNTKQLVRFPEHAERDSERRKNRENLGDGFQPWIRWEGDEYYQIYHSIPAEYNSITLYRGDVYHTIGYDAAKETSVRYSLVGAIT